MDDPKKYELINRAIKTYGTTGGRGDLDSYTTEDIKKAKSVHRANSVHPWFSKYDEIIEEREKAVEWTMEIHKHYRGIAVGYTASVITLSTLQVAYLVSHVLVKSPIVVNRFSSHLVFISE